MSNYKAIDVAIFFIKKAMNGDISDLTPMKLQKLMFFAQSWYIRKLDSSLFGESFERWEYGPVIPSLYREFRKFRSRTITISEPLPETAVFNETDIQFLNKIIEVYGNFTGPQLSWMTHQPGTAWSLGVKGSVITNNELKIGKV